MKLNRWLIASTLAVGSILSAQTAPTPAQIAQNTVQQYAIVLALTSAQQEQALTFYTADATTEATLRTQVTTAQEALVAAVKADNATLIAEAASTLGSLEAQKLLAQATANAQLYAILTTEQQTKFAALLARGPETGGGGPVGLPGPPRR